MTVARRTWVTHIEPRAGRKGFALGEAWRSRELLVFLIERDIRVRYKQTVFGAAWAIAQPLISMVLFTVVFGRLADLPSEGVPYPLFSLAGTVPFAMVSTGLATASSSLVSNQSLIKKVFIHRMLVPTAAVLSNLLDVAIALVVLVVFAGALGYGPTPRLLAVPVLVALGVIIVLGASLAMAAVNVIYRDVRFIVPYLLQAWLFASPVAYSLTAVDADDRRWFALNPFVGVVEGTRWAILGTDPGDLPFYLGSSVLGGAAFLVVGAYVFRRLEPSFADVL